MRRQYTTQPPFCRGLVTLTDLYVSNTKLLLLDALYDLGRCGPGLLSRGELLCQLFAEVTALKNIQPGCRHDFGEIQRRFK